MKQMLYAAAILLLAGAGAAQADSTALLRSLESNWTKCRYATQAMEQMASIPSGLLTSISVVESGRRAPSGKAEAWPWTINAEGRGYYFASKEEAIRAARRLMAAGTRSIDVGCMQVNLRFHPRAFTSLEEAFDPAANVAYAAQFLSELRARSGSWSLAAGHYHSYSPSLNERYAARVQQVWAREKKRPPLEEPLVPALEVRAPERMVKSAAPEKAARAAESPGLRLRASLGHDEFASTALASAGPVSPGPVSPAPASPALRVDGVYAGEDHHLPQVIVPKRYRSSAPPRLAMAE